MTPIDWRVETFSHLPSTQDAAREAFAKGAKEGLVVQALMQTAGRGRLGNSWASPLGNLYMSLLLVPHCPANEAGQLAFVLAVALADAISQVIDPGHVMGLKWPNDVMIDGRKCAGILLETQIDAAGMVSGLIAGVGVNIMAPPDGRVGIKDVAAAPVAIHPFRDSLLTCIAGRYRQWRENGFSPIRDAWLMSAQGLGHQARVRLAGSEIAGVFRDIGPDGALQLELPDGTVRAVQAGEVHFQPG